MPDDATPADSALTDRWRELPGDPPTLRRWLAGARRARAEQQPDRPQEPPR